MGFNILAHLAKLTPVEGKSTAAEGEYYCPVCQAKNFKVNLKTGEYNGFSCDCMATDAGKQRVIDAISPNTWEKPPRKANNQTFTYDGLLDGVAESIAQVCRKDDGQGHRQFYQQHWDGHRWAKGLPDDIKAAVHLFRIFCSVNERAKGGRIFLVEGEGKVQALLAMGIPATCAIGGAGKWKQYGHPNYLEDLKGYQVVLCPDRDEPGVKHCEEVEADLIENGIDVAGWLYAFPESFLWSRLPKSGGADVVDWIADGATKETILGAVEPRRKVTQLPTVEPQEQERLTSKSTFEMAYDLAMEADYFTIPGGAGTVAADVVIDGHRETFQISKRPQQFKDWLQFAMWQKHKKVLGSEILTQIMSVVSCEAKASGVQHSLHIRTASHDGAIYLDLGRSDWQMVKIDDDGWSIIPSQECPIRFIRTSGIGELPIPEPGGTLADLRRLVNVDDQSFVLLMAWMLFCFCPDYDHPILIVSGSAESGKTKLCETIKTLVDPAPTLLMSLPKDERNLKAQATNRWLLGYDNLSGMGNEISDSLCRLATGGGLVDRKLHTDDDESEFSGVRPLMLNGIDALGNRADFRSRGIELNCPPLEYKMTASEYKASLEAIRPTVLGLLLNAVSQALRLAPEHQHVTDTRMGDFECWGTTAETALGFPEGTFLSAFQANIVDLRNAGIESSPVATALIALMADCEQWQGTPSELLVRLEALVSEDIRRSKFFPKDATRLSKTLKRVQTDLQQHINITSRKTNGVRLISCIKVGSSSVPNVPNPQNPDYTTAQSRDAKGALQNPSVSSAPSVPDPRTLGNSQGRYVDASENLASTPESQSGQGVQPARDGRDAKIPPLFYGGGLSGGFSVGCKVSSINNPGWIGVLKGADPSNDAALVQWSWDDSPTAVDWDDLVILDVPAAAMNGGGHHG